MTSNQKYNYDWIYSKTLEGYGPGRIWSFVLYIAICTAIVILTVLNIGDLPWREIFALCFLSVYIVTLLLFVLIALFESLVRDKEIKKCLCRLRKRRIKLNVVGKFKRRADTDIGTAQTFLLLPILILTLVVPFFFSRIIDVEANPLPTDQVLVLVNRLPASSTAINRFLENDNILPGVSLFSLIAVIALYIQLERANVSVIIKHACIEYEVELESQSENSISSSLAKAVQLSFLALLSSFLNRIRKQFFK